ncbi:hypothetical protein XELAEV_18009236mg [Xenopus laevis]|uniref:Uncharacterized protein n=1 Tax=Xenopus laevis TaxID=8355 RepID=A0A974DTM2_XENLA|nr:hypothetical protein XELAEV_18009236mg [Xenopus laevis]
MAVCETAQDFAAYWRGLFEQFTKVTLKTSSMSLEMQVRQVFTPVFWLLRMTILSTTGPWRYIIQFNDGFKFHSTFNQPLILFIV